MLLLKYIYFCFYINLKYLIIHDHIDLTQHFDALHACCSCDLLIKWLYVDHKIYILLADNVKLKTKFDSILRIYASNVSSKNNLIKTKIFLKSLLWLIRMFIIWNFSINENVTTYSMLIFYMIISMIFCSNKHFRYFF